MQTWSKQPWPWPILVCFSASVEFGNLDESSLVQSSGNDLEAEDRELLKAYHHSFDDEKVDLDLIMHILYNICHTSDSGKYIYTVLYNCCGFSFWLFVLLFCSNTKNLLGSCMYVTEVYFHIFEVNLFFNSINHLFL